MFDVGFWELFIILVIALLVVGPERLPGLARKTGLWIRKIRGFMSSVKDDIDKEFATEELKKILKEQAESSGIHEIIEETKSTVEDVKNKYILDAMDDIDNKTSTSTDESDNTKLTEPSADESDNIKLAEPSEDTRINEMPVPEHVQEGRVQQEPVQQEPIQEKHVKNKSVKEEPVKHVESK